MAKKGEYVLYNILNVPTDKGAYLKHAAEKDPIRTSSQDTAKGFTTVTQAENYRKSKKLGIHWIPTLYLLFIVFLSSCHTAHSLGACFDNGIMGCGNNKPHILKGGPR